MKKLLLMLPAMRMGGAEKIALNFIPHLAEHFDLTVALNKLEGELLSDIPEGVRVIEDRLLSFGEIVRSDIKRFRIGKLLRDMAYYLRVKRGANNERNYRYLISRTPALDEEFDIAISYVANVSTQIFSAIDRTRAKKKLAWIHGETTELSDTDLFLECYSSFDGIYCVSGVTREHFISRFPTLSDRTDVYYNPQRCDVILKRSEELCDLPFSNEEFNILSVGRITPEKGYAMIPKMARILLDKGHRAHFYIVGDGPSRAEVENGINELGVCDYVTLLGTKTNPYPYMKACDVYVQPSYEEGYSTTVCEAGILGCAIIGTTTSGGIREQVEDGVSALIAEPTPDSLADAVERLINDPALCKTLRENVKKIDFSNIDEIKKLI